MSRSPNRGSAKSNRMNRAYSQNGVRKRFAVTRASSPCAVVHGLEARVTFMLLVFVSFTAFAQTTDPTLPRGATTQPNVADVPEIATKLTSDIVPPFSDIHSRLGSRIALNMKFGDDGAVEISTR